MWPVTKVKVYNPKIEVYLLTLRKKLKRNSKSLLYSILLCQDSPCLTKENLKMKQVVAFSTKVVYKWAYRLLKAQTLLQCKTIFRMSRWSWTAHHH